MWEITTKKDEGDYDRDSREVDKMRAAKKWIFWAAAALLVIAPMGLAASAAPPDQAPAGVTIEKVRHELASLPYYGVFDNLGFQVEGSTVILNGQVVRPVTRSDAESRVKHIKGVERVENNIEVLPLSSFDNGIRAREYRAIFRTGGLYRYAQGVNPSIHIIVANGHVTLEGVVSNAMDKQLAGTAANTVSGVFSVTNNLQINR